MVLPVEVESDFLHDAISNHNQDFPGNKKGSLNRYAHQGPSLRQSIINLIFILGCCPSLLGGGFYDVDRVHEMRIYFPQSDWDHILDSLYAQGREERLLGTAIIDDVRYDSVGIRYKGHRSYHSDRTKNPINIKLDYIVNKQEIEGYGTLRLANIWDDPSCIREVLGYEIARKYMPAPQANYTVVFINDTPYGLYANVQDIDKLFLQTYFGSGKNARFKGEYSGSPQGHIVWGYLGFDENPYRDLYEQESACGWGELTAFLDTLNHHPSAISRVLNIDRHLWMLAYDNLLVNLDAPINAPHNYYLYRDDAGRFNPIIWDLHMDFGAFTRLIDEDRELDVAQLQRLDPFLHLADPAYPIIGKILGNPEYRKMYVAHMKTILRENLSNDWYLKRAQQLQDIIASHVQADSHTFAPHDTFRRNLYESVFVDSVSIVGIAQLLAGRVAYLSSLSEFQYSAPTITGITTISADAGHDADIRICATVHDADTVMLGFRYRPTDPFEKRAMLDDGRSGDGVAGDGIYGTSLPAKKTEVYYYIYAVNTEAAAFMPARAEYEDYVIAMPSARQHKDK
jgi:hypothetical protein